MVHIKIHLENEKLFKIRQASLAKMGGKHIRFDTLLRHISIDNQVPIRFSRTTVTNQKKNKQYLARCFSRYLPVVRENFGEQLASTNCTKWKR